MTDRDETKKDIVITDTDQLRRVIRSIRGKRFFKVRGEAWLPTGEGKGYPHCFFASVSRSEFTRIVEGALNAGYRNKFTVSIEVWTTNDFHFSHITLK